MLIRNLRFANSQLLVSGKKISFSNDGTADITDPDLFEALLKIKGFTDASKPQPAGANLNLQAVKSISIDELDSITNPAEEPVPEEPIVEELIPEESVVEEPVPEEPIVEELIPEEPVVEEPAPKPRSKSKKKGR